MALTDTRLRALRAKERLYRIADSNGLCIEVSPSGTKLWRYRYRYLGKASMFALGEYPGVSLLAARRKRDDAKALLVQGINPVGHAKVARLRSAESRANTFAAVASEWFKQNSERLTSGTLKRDRRIVDKDFGPWLGALPVADVSPQALLGALRRIQDRGALESAHRARSLAGRIFRYAIATGRAEKNPADNLRGALPAYTGKHFPTITDPDGVGELLRAIHGYSGSFVTACALKLAPLVFVRPGELRSAKWADIDLKAAEWRYTSSKTKMPHIVPLASQAVEILKELKPLTDHGSFVFPSVRTPRRPMSENTINAALRRLGYAADAMTGHGFRAMARTILDEQLGFRPDFIEHQLAHAVRDPLGRAYNRTAHLKERRAMMQSWADYLGGLRANAKIAPIKQRSHAA